MIGQRLGRNRSCRPRCGANRASPGISPQFRSLGIELLEGRLLLSMGLCSEAFETVESLTNLTCNPSVVVDTEVSGETREPYMHSLDVEAWLETPYHVRYRVFDPIVGGWVYGETHTAYPVAGLTSHDGVVFWTNFYFLGYATYDPSQVAWITGDHAFPSKVSTVMTDDGVIAWVASYFAGYAVWDPSLGEWEKGQDFPAPPITYASLFDATFVYRTRTTEYTRGYDSPNHSWYAPVLRKSEVGWPGLERSEAPVLRKSEVASWRAGGRLAV